MLLGAKGIASRSNRTLLVTRCNKNGHRQELFVDGRCDTEGGLSRWVASTFPVQGRAKALWGHAAGSLPLWHHLLYVSRHAFGLLMLSQEYTKRLHYSMCAAVRNASSKHLLACLLLAEVKSETKVGSGCHVPGLKESLQQLSKAGNLGCLRKGLRWISAR